MEPVVSASSLRKTYGDSVALDGVSLRVAAGEVFALVGPNGAGKTTLVRCLTGTTDPDDGAVRLLGEPPARVRKDRIGLLPQEFTPPTRLTARELVGYYAGLYDDAMDPADALAAVGLDPDDDTRYAQLSGGQKRRTCVALALVNEPDVLFLDEPTTGIDPAGRRVLWRLLGDLADQGTTVLLTTHDMAEAERLADRVGLLSDGRLVEVGPPADLVAEFGGDSRLVVEMDSGPDALAGHDALADLAELDALGDLDELADGRFEVHPTDSGLAVEGVRPADIGAVVRALDQAGIAFDRLAWTEPDLEDVYLRLAGDEESGSATRRAADPDAPAQRRDGA